MSEAADRAFVGTDHWRAWAEEQLTTAGYPAPEEAKTGSLEERIADRTRAILDAVTTEHDLTPGQRDHALSLALLLLDVITVPPDFYTPAMASQIAEANAVWVEFLAGGFQVGASARVKRDAFDGERGAAWNGKEGIAKAMRRGSVLVQFPDGAEESFFAQELEGRLS